MRTFAFLSKLIAMKRRLPVLACSLSLAACASVPIDIHHHDLANVRAKIAAAKAADAERCAPEAQAQAVALLYWAAHELEEDIHVYEAGDLIANAKARAGKALKLAKENCMPKPVLVDKPEKEIIISLDNSYFDTNKSELTTASIGILDRAVSILKKYSEARIEIAGHADSRNTDAYNMALSKRRAASVHQYLLAHGIEAKRMMQKGYGESQPVASNDSEEGMAKNRRVELRIR
jgi:outer membrane protein OmpA-like peptidoglycan-associated protein